MIFARWTDREKIITKCCSDLLWVWLASANPRTICRFTSSRLGTNAFATREKLLRQSNPACREMENEWKWWYNVCTFAPLLHSKVIKISVPLVHTSFPSYAPFCPKQRTCCITSRHRVNTLELLDVYFWHGACMASGKSTHAIGLCSDTLALILTGSCSALFKTRLCKTDKHDDSSGAEADAMRVLGGGALVLRILYNVSWHC